MEAELEEQAVSASREVAEELREEVIDGLPEKEHAHRLAAHTGPVVKTGDQYTFTIDHPMASLHENGGPVYPSYGKAKVQGWTRDEIYDALDHCQEQVTKKNYMSNAMTRVIKNHD